MPSNINKFENWIPFNKSLELSNTKKGDIINKNHIDWIKKYPEMKMLKLVSDYYDDTWNWLYSLNKKHDDINIDLFIDIEKIRDIWKINFELVIECEDEYFVNNSKNKSMVQDEKHYEKNNLDWSELNYQLNKICEWIRVWNQDFNKEHGFYPLVD